MNLSTAMTILQIVAGLVLVGYVGKLFVSDKAWKPREHSTDEYLADLERNGSWRR